MKRHALALAAPLVCGLVLVSSASAQTRPGAQAPAAKAAPVSATPAPVAPARFARMVKGLAEIHVIQSPSRKIGNEMVTVLKIKNMSPAAIGLLKVEEYWYNTKTQMVSGDSQPYRKPFNSGEVIELTMKSPMKPDLYRNQFKFTHANGEVKVTPVKKFN